jgi:hypothetical protein
VRLGAENNRASGSSINYNNNQLDNIDDISWLGPLVIIMRPAGHAPVAQWPVRAGQGGWSPDSQ